jgi:hypothetical protein
MKWAKAGLPRAVDDSEMNLYPTSRYAVPAVARFTGSKLIGVLTWGSAALHPRLYAVARSAG